MAGPSRSVLPHRAQPLDGRPAGGPQCAAEFPGIPLCCGGRGHPDRGSGLGIDAYVHLDLAATYSEALAPINEGILFRAEAVLAPLAALALMVVSRSGSRFLRPVP